ncbi:MAG: DUF3551 domain-containing protein [Proteobacteria bacterium]|nr:DUF3551 domain-containing protein [Pseudomonadota bacterium]
MSAPALAHAFFTGFPWDGPQYEHSWCAQHYNSIRDCRYDSLAQCRATISGVGGHCEENLFFRDRPAAARRPYRKARQLRRKH